MTEWRREELEEAARRHTQTIRAIFDDWEKGSDVRATWDKVVGSARTEVVSHGKAADLVVLARPLENEGDEALHATIFETGRLLLYAPPAASNPFGKHVAIAWKECVQAKAAVAAALPWLKGAARVSVLAVGSDGPPDPPQALINMLGDSGIKAEPVLVSRAAESTGGRILKQAHAIDADCIVMGAYRHGELTERLLGGVTRHVLQVADLPVFLHH